MSKTAIKEFMEKVWNEKNIDAIDSYFSKEVKIHSPLGEFRSISEMKKIIQKWLDEIPDIKVTHLHILEGDNGFASHWDAKGTTKDGKPIQYQGITLYQFQDGKVIDYWAYLDGWAVEKQLGKKL